MNNKVRLKFVSFREDFHYLNPIVQSFINQKTFYSNSQKWDDYNMAEVAKFIHKWKSLSFWVDQSNISNIIKEISDVSFPYLQTISITGNKISSIEKISRMKMPSVRELYLNYNNIISVASLRKGYWPYLYGISLSKYEFKLGENRITDIACLCSGSEIKYFAVEFFEKESEQCCDRRVLAKLNIGEDSSRILIKSQKRIKQTVAGDVLRKKYKIIHDDNEALY